MDPGLELISPILEILEIEVFNILYNPGNVRAAGGWLQGLGSGGLDYFWNMFLEKRAW